MIFALHVTLLLFGAINANICSRFLGQTIRIAYIRFDLFNYYIGQNGEKIFYGNELGIHKYLSEALGYNIE